MKYSAATPEEYISQVPIERQDTLKKLRATISEHLPSGFEEGIQYNMIGYYVPHDLYPGGYHCNPKEPLPFMSFASQKNSINLYHSGIYAVPELNQWFVKEYSKHCKIKLDMGKSCIRFKKLDDIPFKLIGELCTKLTPQQWIDIYETNLKRK
ncbi:DUF1801 domain-containing protein [Mangrovimonas sp. AS39]|uniref:DUF1801 domain-containing protein n=1 Tax=Mangrovimonas futianensis TaxID=2895523 RepID=UPI001E4AF242|nr:DUF1801 domain-containing protein [Mangrovimonas futianensis]MCF1190130.1 DUF1801 domain-containing protein [Mangrovimonas futianensis]MCF1194119.1 DUF1801 domain-containing protein [Mangrovimonas futianensis]